MEKKNSVNNKNVINIKTKQRREELQRYQIQNLVSLQSIIYKTSNSISINHISELSGKQKSENDAFKDEKILQRIKTGFLSVWPEGKIQVLFITGSRCYGSNNSTSDYDFVMIAENIPQNRKIENCTLVLKEQNQVRIDIGIFEYSQFQDIIFNHLLWALPFPYYDISKFWIIPNSNSNPNLDKDEFTLLRFLRFSGDEKSIIRYYPLKKAIYDNHSVCQGQALRFFKAGQIKKSKKRIFFFVRHLNFVNQILHYHNSNRSKFKDFKLDFEKLNLISNEFFKIAFYTFEEMNQWLNVQCLSDDFTQFKTTQHIQILDLLHSEIFSFSKIIKKNLNFNAFEILLFLNEFEFTKEQLFQFFSIQNSKISNSQNSKISNSKLYFFNAIVTDQLKITSSINDKEKEKKQLKITKQTFGMILNKIGRKNSPEKTIVWKLKSFTSIGNDLRNFKWNFFELKTLNFEKHIQNLNSPILQKINDKKISNSQNNYFYFESLKGLKFVEIYYYNNSWKNFNCSKYRQKNAEMKRLKVLEERFWKVWEENLQYEFPKWKSTRQLCFNFGFHFLSCQIFLISILNLKPKSKRKRKRRIETNGEGFAKKMGWQFVPKKQEVHQHSILELIQISKISKLSNSLQTGFYVFFYSSSNSLLYKKLKIPLLNYEILKYLLKNFKKENKISEEGNLKCYEVENARIKKTQQLEQQAAILYICAQYSSCSALLQHLKPLLDKTNENGLKLEEFENWYGILEEKIKKPAQETLDKLWGEEVKEKEKKKEIVKRMMEGKEKWESSLVMMIKSKGGKNIEAGLMQCCESGGLENVFSVFKYFISSLEGNSNSRKK